MSTFRFTGQAVTGVPQRPFLITPQMTLTASPPSLVTSHPPMMWRSPFSSSIAIMQPPPNHIIEPRPVVPLPPPPPMPLQLFPPVTAGNRADCLPSTQPRPVVPLPPPPTPPQLFPPVTAGNRADCLPSTQFQPNYAFSTSESKSELSAATQSESKSVESSLRVVYPLSSKLKSSHRDVRFCERTDAATKLSAKSHDKTESVSSQRTDFAGFLFSTPPRTMEEKSSVTVAHTSAVVSTVSSSCGACATSSTIRSVPSDKLSPSVLPTLSSLRVSTPAFVPASGNWKSSGNPDTTGIAKGLESESEVGGAKCDRIKEDRVLRSPEPLLECRANLCSTASLSSPSSSSQPVVSSCSGKSPQSVGRGRQLFDMLTVARVSSSTQSTVGGLLVCLCAPSLFVCCVFTCTKEVMFYPACVCRHICVENAD